MDFLFVAYPPTPDPLFEDAYARVARLPRALRKFRAESPRAVVETLVRYESVFSIRRVDVYCHGTPRGVRLGSENLVHDGEVHGGFADGLRGVLSRNRSRFGEEQTTLRLLSCRSALHAAALTRAIELPRFRAIGTTAQINAADFDEDGFGSVELLSESLEIESAAKP